MKTLHSPIFHKFGGGWINYDIDGITFCPFLTKHNETIPWSNIMFLSPIPGVKLINEKWQTYDGIDLMDSDSLEKLDFFYLQVAIKNKHLIKPKMSLLQSILFYMNFPEVKALYNANDKPDDYEAFLQYRVIKRTLSQPLKELLELISNKSSFDLICTF